MEELLHHQKRFKQALCYFSLCSCFKSIGQILGFLGVVRLFRRVGGNSSHRTDWTLSWASVKERL